MSHIPAFSDRGTLVTAIDLQIWQLAASRLPRPTRIVFQLWSRGRTYDRIAVLMGVSHRRVRRHMLRAIAAIDRAALEVRSPHT